MNKPPHKNRTFPRKPSYVDRMVAEAPEQKIVHRPQQSTEFRAEKPPALSHEPDSLESLSDASLEQVANENFERFSAALNDPATDPEGAAAAQLMVDRAVALLSARGITWNPPNFAGVIG